MSPLASLLMLLLLWGSACAGVWGSPAGTGAGQQPQSPQRFPVSRYRSYQLRVQEVVTVQEGLCVSIPCTFSHPWMGWVRSDPAHGYWFREQTDVLTGAPVATNNPERKVEEGTRGRFQLLGDPRDGSCSLLVRDARRQDAAKYFFQVERGNIVKYNYKEHMVTLRVTDLMQKPDIYVPETLEPGCPATLLCVFPGDSEGCPSPTFSWTGVALSSQGAAPRNYISFSVLPVTPRPQDHKAWLTCGVELKNGVSASNTVQLRVAHAPKDLVIHVFLGTSVREPLGKDSRVDVKKGQFLRLLCEADGHPPPTLSWVLNDRVLSWSPPSGPRSLILERPQVGPEDAGRYTCRAENRLGSPQRWLDLSVQYPPENLTVVVSPTNRTGMKEGREPHRGPRTTPGPMADVVLVAVTAAAVKTLLLSLCLTFSM
ncbi:PREDICTED: sialic acid-binding Ig-like lectin 10-like [Elephantulus edwardii]|uniref:sialic acid-binding Ig-like lectin 10-like n=1 Tax=Elephantulus edwardii TaxID=28737 RepID=UPI0003F0F242|nr:PREDICTED: sialic acid-binding Ig-like lectin 10-like [Elephantulus edwardii]